MKIDKKAMTKEEFEALGQLVCSLATSHQYVNVVREKDEKGRPIGWISMRYPDENTRKRKGFDFVFGQGKPELVK